MAPWRLLPLVLAGALALPAAAHAQLTDGDEEPESPRPSLRAVRVQAAVRVDGVLGERVWARAPAAAEFIQMDPDEGSPATERTEVRIVYGADALYVGARLYDSQPVSSRLGRRDDPLFDSDWFTVSIDSYHDHRTAFEFRVNPAGVRGDAVISGGGGGMRRWFRGDDSWDPVWEVETAVVDSGWTVEMRIPFSQLRFSDADRQIWGIQITRDIAHNREEAVFAFTPSSERGGVARYGHLVGLASIESHDPLEILPYLASRAEYVDPATRDGVDFPDPYRTGSQYLANAGVDLKYRVTPNLTLDATLNPDFGQVEVDPAVVNLSAFETFYDEKRPFFVEGADIFQLGDGGGGRFGGGGRIFYSRRIGRRPQIDVPDAAVYADAPDATTILSAGKLSGRTAGGWSIGVLEAVTGAERAPYVDGTGAEDRAMVEPLTNYFVGRLQRQFREGRTVVGGIATAVNRRLDDPGLAAGLRSSAYAAGLDFSHEWADRAWALSGEIAGSRIAGEPAVMQAAQRSSARYYQRPDADHVRVDPRATSLHGYTARLELEKQAGRHWRGSTEVQAISPGYEVNDLGFQSRADQLQWDAQLRYVEFQPGDVFRDYNIQVNPELRWNYGGDLVERQVSVRGFGQLVNYWGGNFRYTRNFGAFDQRLTRGGPLARSPAGHRLSGGIRSDARRAWWINLDASYNRDEAGGWEYSFSPRFTLRPASSWNVSLRPRYERERETAQYLEAVDDPTASGTYGRRYIFAPLDRTTLSAAVRLNVAFRPGLTLELFAQPFLASGDYDTPQQLREPGTYTFDRFGTDTGTLEPRDGGYTVDPDGAGPAAPFTLNDRDFNLRSLRGNAVLRWQWRPGSTLYLVWQQERADRLGLGRLDLQRDASELLALDADNIFMVKMNYWLNP